MKKIKAFTFVELLLVMLILGVIVTLTLPIIKNIKEDEDIYRAYMKKANQDVLDAMNMLMIKEPRFSGFDMFTAPAGTYANQIANSFNHSEASSGNDGRLQNAFNRGLGGLECGICNNRANNCSTDGAAVAECISTNFLNTYSSADITGNPGVLLGGKTALVFQWVSSSSENFGGERIYGYIYVDMNRDKKPNEYCKDRYKFLIFKDKVAMETRAAKGGCSYTL